MPNTGRSAVTRAALALVSALLLVPITQAATARGASAHVVGTAAPRAHAVAAPALPARLDDSTFWHLVTSISEPSGYFRSNNFVGNETTLQWVIPELKQTVKPGGVYVGVGPDQNFTYLVALRPALAFIVDIRRQNMLTLLMYKALIEESTDRADFVSRLFSRPRPAGLDSSATPEAMFAAFEPVARDSSAYEQNLTAIADRLTRQHGFALSDSDLAQIGVVYNAFFNAGPEITYSYTPGEGLGRRREQMPDFAEMAAGTDSVGLHRGYLASEANFQILKALQQDNLIVPVVGNFAGPKALGLIGAYVAEHDAKVTTFYLSNVEQYLFQQADEWSRFYTNVQLLPIDSTSTFIRSVFGRMGYGSYGRGMRARQLLASMTEQLQLFREGRLTTYSDVIRTSH